MIVKHDCKKESPARDYQYKLYGAGNVVANSNSNGKATCTICGTELVVQSETKKKVDKK